MRSIVLLVHDIRSCHNVGSLLRTAEGLALDEVIFTGYTPYPSLEQDTRLPHIHQKLSRQIHKTSLGAEFTQNWRSHENINVAIQELRNKGYSIVGLEQTETASPVHNFKAPDKIAVLIGREVEGISQELLSECNSTVYIPMFGKKESFNVVQATAMVLFQLRFH